MNISGKTCASWLAVAVLCLAGRSPAAAQQNRQFEYLFTIGAKEGVNPPKRFTGRFGKMVFGAPGRHSPLVAPSAVTVDPEQRIWIADPGSALVQMVDVLRNKFKTLRKAGDVMLQCPSGIASDMHGRIYVVDSCSGEIFVFDRDGIFLRRLVGGGTKRLLKRPWSVLVSRDLRSIYVTDPPRHKVVVFNQEGETVREWGGPEELGRPTALSAAWGRIYVLDSPRGRVQVYSPGGVLQKSLSWDRIRRPSSFAIDQERGLMFVGDPRYQLVHVFNKKGVEVSFFGQAGMGPGEIRTPSSLYVDAAHRIYLVDSLSGKVLVFREKRGIELPSFLHPGATSPR